MSLTPSGNLPLRQAVERFAQSSNEGTYRDVLRKCLQGELLLDATGSGIQTSDNHDTRPKQGTDLPKRFAPVGRPAHALHENVHPSVLFSGQS